MTSTADQSGSVCYVRRQVFKNATAAFPAAGACIWVRCFGSWLSLSNSPSNSVKMACGSF